MDQIQAKRAQRFLFLKTIYDQTGGSRTVAVDCFDLAERECIQHEAVEDILYYLSEEGLIDLQSMGGYATISHRGIIEVEEAMSTQDKPTKHFPAVMNIFNNHGTISGSQMQIGSTDSSQSMTVYPIVSKKQEILSFLSETKEILPQLSLSKEHKAEAECEMDTLSAQAKSPVPKYTILKESLLSLKRIIEGAGGGIAANFLLKYSGLLAEFLGN